MKKYLWMLVCVALSPCHAQETGTDSASARYADVVDRYEQELGKLVQQREDSNEEFQKNPEQTKLNPYFYRLLTPAVYYGRSTHQMMGLNWADTTDELYQQSPILNVTEATDYVLASLYARQPNLVSWTETMLKSQTAIRQDVKAKVKVVEPKLSDKAVTVDLGSDVPDNVAIVAKKPNFWKLRGSTSLQFTQSYFSDNWYQGGEKNYSGLGMVTLEANYDNKQKVQWDNKLELQLGFQTAQSDTCHTFRVTNNLLRLTSKIGYKAAKNWFYTAQAMAYTQLYPNYEKNSNRVIADFTSPFYFNLSVGIDYKLKKEKYELSVYLSPVAYNMCWVDRYKYDIRPRYGMEQHDDGTYKATYHKYGPSVTVNSRVRIMKNVNWTSRFYVFGNIFDNKQDMYVNIEWENTLDFTINKYLSAKFFFYPKFDNSSEKYKKGRHYFMLKEWLSLGLNYTF
ncbi:MAG: DUF3078 domain-containing protein [Bacteroidaceae bacterium]|nr:DUF3078 domain-containing protein [Bacteroidaceae bacterium]